MGKIYCIIGKSGTGKDTVLAELLKDVNLPAEKLVPYTTRPQREGEVEGVNYHYVTKQQLNAMEENGQVIECRTYKTVHGDWSYFTASVNIDDNKNYIIITTQKALDSFFKYFGEARIHVVYLFLENKARLERCIRRESEQEIPNYSEVCRRYLADEDDFDEETLSSYVNYTIVDTSEPLEKYSEEIKSIIKNDGR